MKKPPERTDIPPRNQDNNKRRLEKDVSSKAIAELDAKAFYRGSSKHKRNPSIFSLEPFLGDRGDSTLCDEHANFQPADMAKIPELIHRGVQARLVGKNALLWTVADNGWIFEGRLTNVVTTEYHGYPVRPTEAIAEKVYRRYSAWAFDRGNVADREAAIKCAELYKLKQPTAGPSNA